MREVFKRLKWEGRDLSEMEPRPILQAAIKWTWVCVGLSYAIISFVFSWDGE